jgi:hypothetical protein
MNTLKDSSSSPKQKPPKLSQILRFVDKKVKIMMIIGSLASLINGATIPAMALVFGDIADEFATSSDLLQTASRTASFS